MATTKKNLLDMSQEEVNAMTDEEVFAELDDIGEGISRIRAEIQQMIAEKQKGERELAELEKRCAVHRERRELRRKEYEASMTQ